ncbi:MAG: hypothetical protein CMG25_03660, partial [Candidatus Marinimicrobia bacterium]|nr:hypothetical protein [Candidatus Neomarinimicrobiota bacterium]
MFKIKILLLISILFIVDGCALFSGKKKKKNQEAEMQVEAEEIVMYDEALFDDTDSIDTTNDFIPDDATEFVVDEPIDSLSLAPEESDDDQWQSNSIIEDKVDIYSDVIANFQDDMTRLKSELDLVTEELYELKAKSQIWENPFSIYNKEIILTNGSTVYGKITYQDQDIIYVETLIGGLTLQRDNVKRVIENITQLPDSVETDAERTRRNDILEIKKEEENTIFQPSTKLLANAILIGDISEEVDFRGNRILSGDIKNIGEARADFVKINFVFRMNWQGKTKSLTAFVRGSKHIFPDSNIESDSSIELGAVAEFELVIPA